MKEVEVKLRKVNGGIIWVENGKETIIPDRVIGGPFYEVVRVLAIRMGEHGMWKGFSS